MVAVRKEGCQKDVRNDGFSGLEAISSLMDGENVSGMVGFLLELPADLGNVGVHRPTHHCGPVPPHLLKKFQA